MNKIRIVPANAQIDGPERDVTVARVPSVGDQITLDNGTFEVQQVRHYEVLRDRMPAEFAAAIVVLRLINPRSLPAPRYLAPNYARDLG